LFWLVVAQFIFSTMEGDVVSPGVRYSSRNNWEVISIVICICKIYKFMLKQYIPSCILMWTLLCSNWMPTDIFVSVEFSDWISVDICHSSWFIIELFSLECQTYMSFTFALVLHYNALCDSFDFFHHFVIHSKANP